MRNANFENLISTATNPLGLEIANAEGNFLIDSNGKKYLDFISGISVSNLGHKNKIIQEAVHQQLEKFSFTMVFGEYKLAPQVELAKLLAESLPPSLNTTYLLSTGTESNEASIKLARRHTGREKIVSFYGAYHGSTMGSLSISGNEKKKSAFRPLLPGVEQIRFNSIPDLETLDENTAAVIMETIQGDAGIRIPDKEFMKALRQKCDDMGILLVFDEIQCGLGRTGKLFAFEHFGVIPDVLTLGKALGGGFPLSALISSREILSSFQSNPELGHISTHGGNPVACAASIALLKQIRTPEFLMTVQSNSNYLIQALRKLPFKEVRGMGYFIALEMENPTQVQKMVNGCLERGLVSFWFLSCPEAFRIAPPLNISKEDLDLGIEIISEAISEIGE